MQNLILQTIEHLNAIVSKPMDSIDDREERDMQLDNMRVEIEDIGSMVEKDNSLFGDAMTLLKTLKELGESQLIKELEISLAYAVKS